MTDRTPEQVAAMVPISPFAPVANAVRVLDALRAEGMLVEDVSDHEALKAVSNAVWSTFGQEDSTRSDAIGQYAVDALRNEGFAIVRLDGLEGRFFEAFRTKAPTWPCSETTVARIAVRVVRGDLDASASTGHKATHESGQLSGSLGETQEADRG